MKKSDFFAELGKIHFLVSSYVSLFPYLDCGIRGEVLDAQLDNIRRFDKDKFWLDINSKNLLKKQKSVEIRLKQNGTCLAHKFINLKLSSAIDADLSLWFSSMLMLVVFVPSDKAFLRQVVDFFVAHIRCFTSVNYIQLLELLLSEEMLKEVENLSQRLSLPAESEPEVIMQIFDAKYTHDLN